MQIVNGNPEHQLPHVLFSIRYHSFSSFSIFVSLLSFEVLNSNCVSQTKIQKKQQMDTAIYVQCGVFGVTKSFNICIYMVK